MSDNIKFDFLKDAPVKNGTSDTFGFYHNNVAPALKEIIENKSCINTIGLFGKWGTGKSTIIEMIRDDIKMPMFIFDAWKYQEDSLRRIFLIDLVNFLISQRILEDKDRDMLDSLYKTTEETQQIEQMKERNKISMIERFCIFFKKNWLYFIFSISAIIWVILNIVFKNTNYIINSIKDFSSILSSFSILVIALKPVLEKIWEKSVDKLLSSLQPLSSIKTRTEKEDRLNSPEQFERVFKLILKKINNKIIIVFDNVDRVHGDIALKTLSTIKTFLEPSNNNDIVFIVPCDSDAIISQIKNFYNNSLNNETFDPSEYLRKIFNLIIWTPEFIETDLQEYIKKLINDTGEIKNLIQGQDLNDAVYVISKGFSNNPREIKQFINNLIAALILSSKTEVWNKIKQNIPYLIKTLILRQKFPDAHNKLKNYWFTPENILSEKDDQKLREFMLNTSRITVSNAQPFIYFKNPIICQNINNSEEITISLANGDKEKFKELMIENKNKPEDIIDFIQHLLNDYKSQKEVLFRIFTIHLEIFEELSIKPLNKVYYETLSRILDSDLWNLFAKLPTNLIFSKIINNTELDKQFIRPLIDRYVISTSYEEMKKPNNIKVLKEILTNLKQSAKLLTNENINHIEHNINEYFSTNNEIISIFKTLEEQNLFISPNVFDKFIANIDRLKISEQINTIIQFKDYSLDNDKINIILQRMTDIINNETSESPDYRDEKSVLFTTCFKIISNFKEQLKSANIDIKTQLSNSLIKANNNISSIDNRTCTIKIIRILSFYLEEAQKNEIKSKIDNYFRTASPLNISTILDGWTKESAEIFISNFFDPLLAHSMDNDEVFNVVYRKSNTENRNELIQNAINQKGANSLNIISNLEENIIDRQNVIRLLLTKSTSLPINEQIICYEYLKDKINKNDPVDIKDKVTSQIKLLLSSDLSENQKAGFDILTNANFLGEENKRDIGKDVIEWLRQPGKSITIAHNFTLRAISTLTNIMKETYIKDFMCIVFDMLQQNKDQDSIKISLDIIYNEKPSYLIYEKDFKDLLYRLKDWPDNDNKDLIIKEILKIKPSNQKKEEKDFWIEFESLKKEIK